MKAKIEMIRGKALNNIICHQLMIIIDDFQILFLNRRITTMMTTRKIVESSKR